MIPTIERAAPVVTSVMSEQNLESPGRRIKGLPVRSSRVEDQSEQVGRNLCTTAAGEPWTLLREKRPPNILMYI